MKLKYKEFIENNGIDEASLPKELLGPINKLNAILEAYEEDTDGIAEIQEMDAILYTNLKAAFPLKEGLREELTPSETLAHNQTVLAKFAGKQTNPADLVAEGFLGPCKPGGQYGKYLIKKASAVSRYKIKVEEV